MPDETILTAATTPANNDATLLTPPVEDKDKAAAAAEAAKTAAAPDLTKNADGTPKTADQIAADKKIVDDKAAADAKSKAAPEKYEDFKTPEGVKLAAEDVTAFQTLAKEHNLSQEAAQKFIDMATKNASAQAAAQAKQWAEARTSWKSTIEKDPEIGGAEFAKSKEYAIRAVNKFGAGIGKELGEVFSSGWGDHPALFKAFVRIGKALGEDKVVDGSDKPGAQKSAASTLYGSAHPSGL
jgi:hypothetical protein